MIASHACELSAATRQGIAVSALAGSVPATRLARQFGTSRKFIGVLRDKARWAVQQAFSVPAPQPCDVEAFPRVSQAWVRRFALAMRPPRSRTTNG
jgi:hypothetical protein